MWRYSTILKWCKPSITWNVKVKGFPLCYTKRWWWRVPEAIPQVVQDGQSPDPLRERSSAVFTPSPVQVPCDHQSVWGWFRRWFAAVIPSSWVNPESINEKTRKDNETQHNSRRSDLVLRDQEKMQMRKQRQRTAWGIGIKPKMDSKRPWYMFKVALSKTTQILNDNYVCLL